MVTVIRLSPLAAERFEIPGGWSIVKEQSSEEESR